MDMEERENYEEKKCCQKCRPNYGYCKCEECGTKKCCVDLIITFLSILFALTLGVILGTVFGVVVFIQAIVLAIVLGILLIIRIIMLACCNRKKKYC